ncbi:MAG: glycosyltransferase [Anaerolineaceae bacterium]|nr:glycosyltransferase [Anaerolineaceae bacterium]
MAASINLYKLVLESVDTLPDDDKEAVYQLLDTDSITPKHLEEALAIHTQNRTPMRDILGSMGYVNPKDYAAQLAQANNTGYVSDLVGSEFFDYDADFVRRFNPADLIRHLFCPLRQLDNNTVIVLAVNPNEPELTALVQQIVPGVEILAMVGTEINVTRLVNSLFQKPLLHHAVNHLREARPTESASTVFTRPQIATAIILATAFILGLFLNASATLAAFVVLISVIYTVSIFYKLALSLASENRTGDSLLVDQVNALDDAELPIYSILVPVYKEPEVVPRLLKALSRIDYPREKLDVLLLMEEDDLETITKAKEAAPPSFFRFIIVPESLPRTKPKACNYGLNFCRGKYVTIYDAEDIPEPDQLKKAVAAFETGGDSLICVQAALNYFNAEENYLTRMFTLEYTYWFDTLLPGLDRLKLPIPLGGTSNHFRLDKLQELGAWDPFNVTEDADLGIRASCNGYTVGVIRSTTYEEANKAYKNWLRQRSRWIKGYMQTWLVHNRNPLILLRNVGLKDWLSYNLFIGGTVAIFLINPLMWLFFATWLLFHPVWMGEIFSGWVWYVAFFSLIVGNGTAILLNIIGVLKRKNYKLLAYALTNPMYWCMHSISAYIGLWQLITKPFYWEKTDHGLTKVNTEALFEEVKAT